METNYRKTNLVLPASVSKNFSEITGDTEKRNNYVAELRAGHWTLQSISAASGLTRERVRQLSSGEWEPTGLEVPEPPKHVEPTPREYVEPDPGKLARLIELKPLAEKVRSNSDNYRREAEEYTALIAEVHLNDGVTLYRLAKRLGLSHGALRFRLARYGYKQPATGTSKVYKTIRSENRV